MTRDYTKYRRRQSSLVSLVELNHPDAISWLEYQELLWENGYVDTGNEFAYLMSITITDWVNTILDYAENEMKEGPDKDDVLHELNVLKSMADAIQPKPLMNKEKLREAAVSLVCSIDNEEGFFASYNELQCTMLDGVS